jgi:chemosensory pili system protein ChpA (sensor histidine kinase/response regulator)
VLESIGSEHRTLTANPGDREALRNVRRAFHTLKGSGRMVGLKELGELAWDVERVHNKLLDEERPVTPAVLDMIKVAHESFSHWVGQLSTQGRVAADATALHAAIAAVEGKPAGPTRADAPSTPPAGAVGRPDSPKSSTSRSPR